MDEWKMLKERKKEKADLANKTETETEMDWKIKI
jgi:hypothetical protein